MRLGLLRLVLLLSASQSNLQVYAQQATPSGPSPLTPNTGAKPIVPPAPVNSNSYAPPASQSPAVPVRAGDAKPAASAPLSTSAPVRPSLQKFADNLAILQWSLGTYVNPRPEQKGRILTTLNTLKALSLEAQPAFTLAAADPILHYVSWELTQQFTRLEAAYNAGDINQARSILRQTFHYCLGTGSASKGTPVLQFPEPPNNMSELDKAEYYAATKRFEEAMLAYERVLSDKQFKAQDPDTWEKAVTNLMAITVRKRNAHITLEMSSALLQEGGYNSWQKEMLQAWRSSAKTWTQDDIGKKSSGAELLVKAQQLIDKGNQLSGKGRSSGNIEHLRALSLLSDLAMSAEADAVKAKGFQLSGKASERLPAVYHWMRADVYYEACVRSKPHSTEAKECLKSIEALLATAKDAAFERERLRQLQELAR